MHGSRMYITHIKTQPQNPVCGFRNTSVGCGWGLTSNTFFSQIDEKHDICFLGEIRRRISVCNIFKSVLYSIHFHLTCLVFIDYSKFKRSLNIHSLRTLYEIQKHAVAFILINTNIDMAICFILQT